jgi:replicative DNA helicase
MQKLEIPHYKTIDTAFDEAFNLMEDIAHGRLFPLITSIQAESKKLRGLLPTDQMVIAARTGMGKTSKVIHMINDFLDEELNSFYKGKLIILYDSWEISSWRNAVKLLSIKSEMTAGELLNWENKLTHDQLVHLRAIGDEFKGKPLFISEFSDNIQDWYDRKKAISKKYPYPEYQIVNIIDHSRLVTNSNNDAEEKLLNNFMKASIRSRKENNNINIFLSQMNRNIENSSRDRSDIGNTLPISSDIFGSDAVFQSSEFVVALHRPGAYNLTEFALSSSQKFKTGLSQIGANDDTLMLEVVLKNRNGETGLLMLEHDLKYNHFRDINLTDYKIDRAGNF